MKYPKLILCSLFVVLTACTNDNQTLPSDGVEFEKIKGFFQERAVSNPLFIKQVMDCESYHYLGHSSEHKTPAPEHENKCNTVALILSACMKNDGFLYTDLGIKNSRGFYNKVFLGDMTTGALGKVHEEIVADMIADTMNKIEYMPKALNQPIICN